MYWGYCTRSTRIKSSINRRRRDSIGSSDRTAQLRRPRRPTGPSDAIAMCFLRARPAPTADPRPSTYYYIPFYNSLRADRFIKWAFQSCAFFCPSVTETPRLRDARTPSLHLSFIIDHSALEK